MPSKAAGRFGEFEEKLESIPYGLGILIPIFFVFAAIIGLVYDIEDKEKSLPAYLPFPNAPTSAGSRSVRCGKDLPSSPRYNGKYSR